jgi:hypothetical protein
MEKVEPWENVSWRDANWRVSLDRTGDRTSVLTIEKREQWGWFTIGTITTGDLVIGLGELRDPSNGSLEGFSELDFAVQAFARLPVDAQMLVVNAISDQLGRVLEWGDQ